jgi:hypothetical protein
MTEKKRNYRDEYDSYHGTKEQIKRRAQRNKARKDLGLKEGDPREAGHVGSNRKGPLGSKVRPLAFKKNRGDQPKRDGSQD